jgi:hypothetical protein
LVQLDKAEGCFGVLRLYLAEFSFCFGGVASTHDDVVVWVIGSKIDGGIKTNAIGGTCGNQSSAYTAYKAK